jgi:HSP20 family protein
LKPMKTLTQNEPRKQSEMATTRNGQRAFVSPEVNIFEEKDGYVLQAEMPGVPKDGIEVTLEGNELTITGHRHEHEVQGNLLYRESRPMDYRRVFEIDSSIDTNKIEARMEQGVLTLHLPKQERVKPRKITVTD